MKIAILTSGILPVPAVQGGAVENLVDFYLDYNHRHQLHDITIYSVWHPDVQKHPAMKSSVNHYRYIKVNGWWAKLQKKIYLKTHGGEEYYHYVIEYFFHQALKHIRRQHYDLIILENRPGYALKLKDNTNAKMVVHLHNDLLNSKTRQASDIYDASARIITISDFIKSKVQTIKDDDHKTKTVLNGINLTAFTQSSAIDRQALGFSDDDFVVVFSGRVNKEKGVLELVEAMNLLQAHTHIKLLVIGSSFYGNAQGEDDFTRTLKEKAAPLQDRIVFTGFIPYSRMPSYLRMADIAALPSTWEEPLGLTCIESMACGLPVITTLQGGIPETVTTNCGILLTADEQLANKLAAAILDLYHHPKKRKQMAEAALQRSRLFDKDAFARHFFEALEA